MPSAMSRTISGANGEEPSESELPVKYSALIRLFVCPVCHEYMKPPIPQCKKGHVLCVDCRPKVKGVCPLCKQKVGNQTNIMMEQMCDLIRFPCGYSVKGCTERVLLKEKAHHEAICGHRPVCCEHSRRGCQAVLSLRTMSTHVRQCHFRPP